MLEHGIETKLKLFAMLEVGMDAMRPRIAGGAHSCALESVLTHDFFHYCYRETRTAKMAGLKLF